MVGGSARRSDQRRSPAAAGLGRASPGPTVSHLTGPRGSARGADVAGWDVVARPFAHPSASSRNPPDPWSGSLLGADAIARSSSGPSRSVPVAVPKFKMSRARTRSRRAQWKASNADLVQVTVRGRTAAVPRRLAKAYQRGLIQIDD